MIAAKSYVDLLFRYILRILGWARKYGLRVNLDLHTIPGSQNGEFATLRRRPRTHYMH